MAVLVLGSMCVDVVYAEPPVGVAAARPCVLRVGGAATNIAIAAARSGAAVALAGVTGEIPWGPWLRSTLAVDGIDLGCHAFPEGERTRLVLAAIGPDGEATLRAYGNSASSGLAGMNQARVEEACTTCDALVTVSSTLVDAKSRALAMALRAQALAAGRPVMMDANMRMDLWRDADEAVATVLAWLPGTLFTKVNAAEATRLTGEVDAERAAAALVDAGARCVVVSLGARGAILRGAEIADAPAPRARVRNTLGAGDILTGALIGRLALGSFGAGVLGRSLRESVRAATVYAGGGEVG